MIEDADKKDLLKTLRLRSQEVFEYEPKELFLSIDGDLKASQKIEENLTGFNVELGEMPEFIEIYGEHDVRLAFMNITDDTGKTERVRQFVFNFSDERKITVNLEKEFSKVILRAEYENPHFNERQFLSETFSEEISLAEFLSEEKSNEAGESRIFGTLLDSRPKTEDSFVERLRNLISFTNPKSLIAGGALAALVITAILIVQVFVAPPNISAAEIIRKTAEAEQTNETDTGKINYRVLNFEEKTGDGAAVKKRRIEIFKDADRKLSVSRLFDENDRLIAGEWRRQDGVSTFYSMAKTSELRLYRTDREIIDQDSENLWRLSVTATGFESIVDSPANVTAEERAGEYQLNYQPKSENGVTNAVLIVKRNLHASKLFLTVKQNERLREFSFTETAFERKDRRTVEKTAFEPNSEFLKNALTAEKNVVDAEKPDTTAIESESKTASATEISSVAATPELEVKVLQLLSNANALSGEQINITKTSGGKIQVKGIVDEKKRKDEILNVLAEVRSNPAVIVNIQTAEEASRNNPSKTSGAELENISVESKNSIPAGGILRTHFSSKGLSDEKIESEIRRFSANLLAKSAQARRSALQMKQIAERFSPSELEKMDEQTKNDWRRLIKQNAANLAQSSESLRGELRAALSLSQGNGGAVVNSASDAEIIKTARKLFEISLALDRDVRASFSSGTNRTALPVKSAAFADNLEEIINLARQLK